MVRFGIGTVCDTRCADAGIFNKIVSKQMALSSVRMFDSPPELRHEYRGPDSGSKETQLKRK